MANKPAWLEFAIGVGSAITQWLGQGTRWLIHEERLIGHFIRRFIAVEKRLRGSKHFTFPLRFLRYVIYHYHLIPPWLRIIKLLVLIGAMLAQPLWYQVRQSSQQETLYSFYYKHGLEHYRQFKPEAEAATLAASYAQEFADYYTSTTYKQALRSALPEVPSPRLKQAAAKALPAIRTLTIAPVGLDLIRYFESLRLKPYRDPAGRFTIGYGHLIRKGEAFTGAITLAKAQEILRKDVATAELIVKRYVKVPLSISQFSALVSLAYNIGEYQFRTSTLLRVINQRNYAQAAEEIRRWEKAGGKTLRGLTKRRYAEYLLYTGKWLTPKS